MLKPASEKHTELHSQHEQYGLLYISIHPECSPVKEWTPWPDKWPDKKLLSITRHSFSVNLEHPGEDWHLVADTMNITECLAAGVPSDKLTEIDKRYLIFKKNDNICCSMA